jgi:hypothetical protein
VSTIDEKRVYAARTGRREAYVATGMGVVVVAVSGDLVGDFGIEHRGAARDVAAAGARVAVATDEDVLATDGDGFVPLGFGPARVVGVHDGRVLAADDDGRVAVRTVPDDLPAADAGERGEGADAGGSGAGTDAEAWTTLGTVEGPRAASADLVAAADGVHLVREEGLSPAGLDDARDVAAAGPYAATGEGLYALGNGWMREREGAFRAVAACESRAAAVDEAAGVLVRHRDRPRHGHGTGTDPDASRAGPGGDEGDWRPLALAAAEPAVDVAVAMDATYAVTGDGTFVVEAGDGPRTQPLGLRDVAGLAVREPEPGPETEGDDETSE